MTKCKNCNCNCHCSLKEHSDMYGVCSCTNCDCKEEWEACQQIQKNAVACTQKKKKTTESAVKAKNKSAQNLSPMNKVSW